MGLFNKQEHDDQWYEKRIEELENELTSLKDECRFWQVSSNRRYDEINELKDKIKTMKSILDNLVPHQVPTIEIDQDYFELLAYNKKAKAFHPREKLPYKERDYVIIKPKKDSESTRLARITKVKSIKISEISSISEDLGFCNGHMAKRDIRFTYPDLGENESIYVYYVDILSMVLLLICR